MTSESIDGGIDDLLNQHFAGKVVRKDLTKLIKEGANVPVYVLEYLLGMYCASNDEEIIRDGMETVKTILAENYVRPDEAEKVKSKIKERGSYKVIDKVTVRLNERRDIYEALLSNLGVKDAEIPASYVKQFEKLLAGGIWCIVTVHYYFEEGQKGSPFTIGDLKPIQLPNMDLEGLFEGRKAFSEAQWIDVLCRSTGMEPSNLDERVKWHLMVRMIPFVENNYNCCELGPRGTGKSHIYKEISPNSILISGGQTTVANLFYNMARRTVGLVGLWDVVAFDEVAGISFKDKDGVQIMKDFMASGSFARGKEEKAASASMVFVGNTQHTVPYMLKHSDLFDELPESYHDSAYLDRLHFYIPGWEVETIRGEMFSDGYGFVVDYIAEVLKSMRDADYSDRYQEHFTLGSDISTRDRDGIHKTFSGLMKILYPHGEAAKDELEEILRFAIEGRKRVKDQIIRIDTTMAAVNFGYSDKTGEWHAVTTLEEDEYPTYYNQSRRQDSSPNDASDDKPPQQKTPPAPAPAESPKPPALFEGHREFQENQRGVSYETLLLPYLRGATEITIVDPYIRLPHQGRNLVDLLSLLASAKDPADEISVNLVTKEDTGDFQKQHLLMLKEIQDGAAFVGINFNVQFDEKIHDRSIRADNGWKILLGRGLDIFQKGSGSQFDIGSRRQEFRQVVAFGVTYLSEGSTPPVGHVS